MGYVGRPPANATLSSADIADGIIVAADLAPDSVGASELADDAVDTAAIADSVTLVTPNLGTPSAVTLTNATFPSGHIIQIQYSQVETFGHMTGCGSTVDNYTVIKSSGSASTNLSDEGMIQVAITPKSGSTVKLEAQWMGELNENP